MVFFYYTIPFFKICFFTQGRKNDQKEADFKAKSPQNQPKKRKNTPIFYQYYRIFLKKSQNNLNIEAFFKGFIGASFINEDVFA